MTLFPKRNSNILAPYSVDFFLKPKDNMLQIGRLCFLEQQKGKIETWLSIKF